VAGNQVTFTVTATDAYGNLTTNYGGTVHFTSTDPQAVLPPDTTLTNGTGSFTATLKTAGSRSISATAPGMTTASAVYSVTASTAVAFVVTAPATATAGTAFSFTVVAVDQFGNQATGYTGSVTFSSTDPAATVPASGAISGGKGTFSATLKSAGTWTISATDSANSFTGTSNNITTSSTVGRGV
jgi:hypothetical protein